MKNNSFLSKILNKVISIAAKIWEAIELVFKKKSGIKVLSLLVALSIFVFVRGETGFNLFAPNSKTFHELGVVAKLDSDDLVALGLENLKVDVTIEGDYNSLNLITNSSNIEPFVDLSKLSDGTHSVLIQVDESSLPAGVDVKVNPKRVNVKIAKKNTASKMIEIETRNEASKNAKLVISTKSANQKIVVLRGANEDLNRVSVVKVEVNVENIATLGEVVLLKDHFRSVPYDIEGKEVKNIEVLDEDLSVTLFVESPSKELPFTFTVAGALEKGFAISSIVAEPKSNVVYGSRGEIDKLLSFDIKVDVANLKQNKVETTDLTLPAGATAMDNHTAKLFINIEKEISKDFAKMNDGESFKINKINDPNKFNVSLAEGTVNDLIITIIGAESLVNNFDISQINISVDMANIKEGTNSVPLIIDTKNPYLKGIANKNTIELVAEKK